MQAGRVLLVCFGASLMILVAGQPAYASSQDLILGFNPIHVAIGITTLGLALRIGLGISSKKTPFSWGHIFTTLVIGFFASLPIVATALHNIPEGIDDLSLFVMVVGMLGTTVGIDASVKSAAKRIMRSEKDNSPPGRDD